MQNKSVAEHDNLLFVLFLQERFRNDCNLAVQMLQCRPSDYMAHKLNTVRIYSLHSQMLGNLNAVTFTWLNVEIFDLIT